MTKTRFIYIVASQSGSIVSKAIRWVTGAQYNHVSISVDSDLSTLYSFGRRLPWNPLWGGFVEEHPGYGTLARFPDATAKIMRLPVTEKQYWAIRDYLMAMYRSREAYHYNYKGLFLAALDRPYQKHNHYYCSEFVKDVLVRFGVVPAHRFGAITQPQQLLEDLPEGQILYEGIFNDCPFIRRQMVPFFVPMPMDAA